MLSSWFPHFSRWFYVRGCDQRSTCSIFMWNWVPWYPRRPLITHFAYSLPTVAHGETVAVVGPGSKRGRTAIFMMMMPLGSSRGAREATRSTRATETPNKLPRLTMSSLADPCRTFFSLSFSLSRLPFFSVSFAPPFLEMTVGCSATCAVVLPNELCVPLRSLERTETSS